MSMTKRAFVGSLITATAALMVLNVSPAQAAPNSDKGDGAGWGISAAVDDSLAPDHTGGTKALSSAAATSTLETRQARIARYVATNGTRYSFGSYLDGTTGKIVLSTNAPGSVVSSLISQSGMTTAQRQVASQVQVRISAARDVFNRRDDVPSFWGGAGLSAEGFLCSAGYAVQNSAGARFMVTAGHCFNNGAAVRTESGANAFGTVSNRHLPTVTGEPLDFELIGGSSYAGRIYTGGVTSTTSIPVVSAGGAVVGFDNYCHSGRTTGDNCGHTANSINAQVCTQTGCKSPVIAFTGGNMIQGGDSGGTFYAQDSRGAFIRGNVIASDGTTGWASPWTTISPTLGVSIVTD